jgi:hypothetical protein
MVQETLFGRMAKTVRDAAIEERIRAAGERARKEAEAKRQARHAKAEPAREVGGPAGLEPTRYGDWERKGVASDF